MQKNDLIELKIEDMGNDGEGIGRYEGMAFFVKDAIVGDVVAARITKLKKNFGYARVEKICKASAQRVEPACPLHKRCGGCQIQAMDYAGQLNFKERKVRNNLIRIGGFPAAEVAAVMEPAVGMEHPYRYRNKAQFPVGRNRDGEIVAGFYAARTHTIIPVEDCRLGVPVNREILNIVLAFMRENRVAPYDEETGTGLVRHVLIRYGFSTGEIMVCLVINGEQLPMQERLVEELCRIEGMTSISLNRNTKRTNVILGDVTETIWGQPYITDYIYLRRCSAGAPDNGEENVCRNENVRENEDVCENGNVRENEKVRGDRTVQSQRKDAGEFARTDTAVAYHISPQSFYQVNPGQTEKLYSLALEYAGLTGTETVWDLYCGIGTISLFLAQRAKQVYGVEIVPQAVEDARNNARLNGITNAEFFVGKAEEVLPEFYERAAGRPDTASGSADMLHPDVIVVDPPRKGCDAKCLATMLQMQPERIVYVSCDPATLARDLRVLCDGGYELKKVRPVDQFGHTMHVETVVLLSQLRPDDYIDVELDLDELDVTAAEQAATYQEIKDYIMAKHGVKVHTAYIAQVKKKYGLDMRKNYHLSKNEKYIAKQCTEEKEMYIKEALKHFAMIG